ncbi:hypothetical protein Aph01nite_73400 [Acrocarpospora phusangensis]|uniref:Secreted protein n=1 Tax=Acrocarpospora phusangensis TaxID=1070424 RepID=A0A919UV39_9ACTN|nr:hypothetical protein [Acrocarpospora phusangensis]GIH29030.1 hypothetical protein Aph01nite_73400 [Acrocarpospora phusangensis]
MNPIRAVKRVAGPVALLAALSLGLTVATASPAAAAPRCSLTVTSLHTYDQVYKVEVSCGPFLAPAEWHLYGDDGPYGNQYILSSYQPVAYADSGAMDEDDGFDTDEVFATVVYRTTTGAYWTVRTNTVVASFWPYS